MVVLIHLDIHTHSMHLEKSVLSKLNFLISQQKIYYMGTQKNSLNETVLLSTQTHVKTDG